MGTDESGRHGYQGPKAEQVLWTVAERASALWWGWGLVLVGLVALAWWSVGLLPDWLKAPGAAAWLIGIGAAVVRRAKQP